MFNCDLYVTHAKRIKFEKQKGERHILISLSWSKNASYDST